MPVQIGATAPDFSDPTGLLSDCHRRVEMFLEALRKVAEISHQPLDEDARKTLFGALRYFREAAPKHTADEEESLFPRMRRMDDPEVRAALAKIDSLEEDHKWAQPLHDEADRLGVKCLAEGSLSADEALHFHDVVAKLTEMYRRHIDLEDREIFPVAARAMSTEQKNDVGKEMAARRQVKPAIVNFGT